MPPKKDKPAPSFEASLRELDRVVKELESGALGLDDALATYEKGVRLLGQCHGLLDKAERQVALMTDVDAEGNPRSVPFPVALADESNAEADQDNGSTENSDVSDDDAPF